MQNEEITLYKCHRCALPIHSDRLDNGLGCQHCGSLHVQKAPPNFRYVSAYLLHNPRLIPKFIKENILRWA
jgi:DNA-directed RNA polymerase subunit RPC12/RpoP